MNILIMGATGYLGSHVLDALSNGNSIFIICREKKAEKLNDVVCILNNEYVQLFQAKKIDWVINCIGVYQRERSRKVIEGNLIYPLQVIDAAVEHGVKNILNINTSLPGDLNLYAFTKKELGRFGKFYSMEHGINFYNLLVEMFYGKNEPAERFFTSVINGMKRNEDIFLTEGHQKRDVVHIEDVCQAIKLVMHCGWHGYHDIPVGTGEGHSIREMVEYIHEKLNSSSNLLFGAVPMRRNEPDSIADISLLTSMGYKVKYPWKKGLEDVL